MKYVDLSQYDNGWFRIGAGRLKKGSWDRYLNHLYTIKKWNVRQERIQEILYWSHGASRYQDDLYASTTERIKRQSLNK